MVICYTKEKVRAIWAYSNSPVLKTMVANTNYIDYYINNGTREEKEEKASIVTVLFLREISSANPVVIWNTKFLRMYFLGKDTKRYRDKLCNLLRSLRNKDILSINRDSMGISLFVG